MDYRKLFFGDKELQAKVERSLTANLANGGNVVHYVTAGPRAGKSSCIKNALDALQKKHHFQTLNDQDAEAFWEASPERQRLWQALENYHGKELTHGKHYTIMCNETDRQPHFVINIKLESHVESTSSLNPVIYAFQSIPENIAMLIDAPNTHIPLVPGHQTVYQGNRYQKTNGNLQQLADNYPKLLKIYSLEYSLPQIKATLWERRNDEKAVEIITEFLEIGFNVNIRIPRWKRILQLLKDTPSTHAAKAEYDKAFDSLIAIQADARPTHHERH